MMRAYGMGSLGERPTCLSSCRSRTRTVACQTISMLVKRGHTTSVRGSPANYIGRVESSALRLPQPADGLVLFAVTPSHAANGSTPLTPAPSVSSYHEAIPSKHTQRKERLATLLELKRIYQGILHAKSCLELPSPVYQAPERPEPQAEASSTNDTTASEDSKEREISEAERSNNALAVVAEMQLISDQLKASLRLLPQGFGWVFGPSLPSTSGPGDGASKEDHVRTTARDYSIQLRERVVRELPFLPFGGEQQAQVLIDTRNSRYMRPQAIPSDRPSSSGSADSDPGTMYVSPSPIERLERAEMVAEQFVERRIKPALRRAREAELGDLLRDSSTYLKGLWDRLNGGGRSGRRSGLEALQLPVPPASLKESELAISQLALQLESLEKQLQEASKTRESKLRKAGLPGRVQMAIQLKGLDADVLELSRLLAVRTLQLEMEFVFRSLEDEALDMSGYDASIDVLADRESSTSELALLVAEFVMLDEQLTALSEALSGSGGAGAGEANDAGRAASSLGIVGEDVLEKLAVEIPDFRARTGVMDQTVFGGQGMSLTRLQLQSKDSLDKVREAIDFLVRGVRLLGSDVGTSGRLFMRAALGGTLKPREVSALRRTARDVLTFIPFTIILIIPLTPLGHVLVFSLIQTYFPSFFPSCFTKRRQEIMVRYEELQRQLLVARDKAEQAEEEAELARAAAAVARLTAPENAQLLMSTSGEETEDVQVSRALSANTGLSPDMVARTLSASERGLKGSESAPEENGSFHVEKVKALEEKLRVLEDVNLSDSMEEDSTLDVDALSSNRGRRPPPPQQQ